MNAKAQFALEMLWLYASGQLEVNKEEASKHIDTLQKTIDNEIDLNEALDNAITKVYSLHNEIDELNGFGGLDDEEDPENPGVNLAWYTRNWEEKKYKERLLKKAKDERISKSTR